MVQVKQQSKVKNEYERKAAMKPSKNIIPLKNYILIIKHKKYYNWGVWGGGGRNHFSTIGPMIPQTEEDYVTYHPLGQLCKITTHSAKVSR